MKHSSGHNHPAAVVTVYSPKVFVSSLQMMVEISDSAGPGLNRLDIVRQDPPSAVVFPVASVHGCPAGHRFQLEPIAPWEIKLLP